MISVNSLPKSTVDVLRIEVKNPKTKQTRTFAAILTEGESVKDRIARVTERVEDETPIRDLPPRDAWEVKSRFESIEVPTFLNFQGA